MSESSARKQRGTPFQKGQSGNPSLASARSTNIKLLSLFIKSLFLRVLGPAVSGRLWNQTATDSKDETVTVGALQLSPHFFGAEMQLKVGASLRRLSS